MYIPEDIDGEFTRSDLAKIAAAKWQKMVASNSLGAKSSERLGKAMRVGDVKDTVKKGPSSNVNDADHADHVNFARRALRGSDRPRDRRAQHRDSYASWNDRPQRYGPNKEAAYQAGAEYVMEKLSARRVDRWAQSAASEYHALKARQRLNNQPTLHSADGQNPKLGPAFDMRHPNVEAHVSDIHREAALGHGLHRLGVHPGWGSPVTTLGDYAHARTAMKNTGDSLLATTLQQRHAAGAPHNFSEDAVKKRNHGGTTMVQSHFKDPAVLGYQKEQAMHDRIFGSSKQAAYSAGGLQMGNYHDYLAAKLAAVRSEDTTAKGAPDMPYTVDHPYMSRFGASTLGAAAGLVPGMLGGAVLAASHGHVDPAEAVAAGGVMGSAFGAGAGALGAVAKHYMDRKQYADDLEAAGHDPDDMPFVMKHPYLSAAPFESVSGGLGTIGMSMYHGDQKGRFQKSLDKKAAYDQGAAYARAVCGL